VQTKRLAASFDALTRSLTHTATEIFPRKATCVQAFFLRKSSKAAGRQSVKFVYTSSFKQYFGKLAKSCQTFFYSIQQIWC